jgi:hypothetical protein
MCGRWPDVGALARREVDAGHFKAPDSQPLSHRAADQKVIDPIMGKVDFPCLAGHVMEVCAA